MPDINVGAKLRGGFFKTNLDDWMAGAVDAIKEGVAQEAYDLTQIHLAAHLQNPTGLYQSKIQTEKVGKDWHVNDDNIIYGGWLEGVTERNAATRFKGYHTFRTVLQDIRKVGNDIAKQILSKFMGRLN